MSSRAIRHLLAVNPAKCPKRSIPGGKIFNLESGIELDSNFSKCQAEFARGGRGASSMPVILSDLLLFGCIAASMTWFIIEVVTLLS